MERTPRTLTTTIRYRHANGQVLPYRSSRCYRLSNAYRDARARAEAACKSRGETFHPVRIILPEPNTIIAD